VPRSRHLAIALVLASCGPKAVVPEPGEPKALSGRLIVQIIDPAADEGASWDIVLGPDGRYVGEYTWSDGATDFRNDCAGTRVPADVERWFERARASATLERPPPYTVPADLGAYVVTLGYEGEDGTVRYLPADVDPDALRTWAQGFISGCG